ncbi:NUDIX domain-containing protein [Thalassobacillus hwangdonensis]|uniref:NUDIX domain-containing protein n=1 Tax=Thalassobacillus hwangdonensis TaxID=546108 RepID=A0ABW3L4V7_9BACI
MKKVDYQRIATLTSVIGGIGLLLICTSVYFGEKLAVNWLNGRGGSDPGAYQIVFQSYINIFLIMGSALFVLGFVFTCIALYKMKQIRVHSDKKPSEEAVEVTTYVNWGSDHVKLTWKPSSTLPNRNLITSVHGICFSEDQVMLVHLKDRGWDLPGGRIKETESPEQCLKREVMEEGYVSGEASLLGYIIVDHTENQNWKADYPYPKIGFQVFYRMDISEVHTFEAENESITRVFIDKEKVAEHHHEWNVIYEAILDEATKHSPTK